MTLVDDKLLSADPLLAEMVRILVDEFHPIRIYLFGSKARGDSGPDSDYDLLMILASVDKPRYRIAQKALELLWDTGTAVDVLVWTLESFESKIDIAASVPSTVIREGKLLYAA